MKIVLLTRYCSRIYILRLTKTCMQIGLAKSFTYRAFWLSKSCLQIFLLTKPRRQIFLLTGLCREFYVNSVVCWQPYVNSKMNTSAIDDTRGLILWLTQFICWGRFWWRSTVKDDIFATHNLPLPYISVMITILIKIIITVSSWMS